MKKKFRLRILLAWASKCNNIKDCNTVAMFQFKLINKTTNVSIFIDQIKPPKYDEIINQFTVPRYTFSRLK